METENEKLKKELEEHKRKFDEIMKEEQNKRRKLEEENKRNIEKFEESLKKK